MKILLATDGSECSEEAARFLTRFNFTNKDEIEVVHVISDIPYEDDYHAQIRKVIKKVAPKILCGSADILRPLGAKISLREEEGYPDTTIIEMAVDSDADVIVMGCRGVKGINRLFLGSSTRSVATSSPKPVLVVKHHNGKISGSMKVLFATDGSAPAESAGRLLSKMPFPDDAEAVIMHVLWSPIAEIPEKYLMEINERDAAEGPKIPPGKQSGAEKIIEETRSCLCSRFGKMHIMTKTGDPSVEILNAEKILSPDIIALGCRGLRGVKGMMGSVSRRILDHSSASVLIGKAG